MASGKQQIILPVFQLFHLFVLRVTQTDLYNYFASYQLSAELQSTTKSTRRGWENGIFISSIYP